MVKGESLQAAGLATGNPFVANPVYANGDGVLLTGYKLGYYSIPPIAFQPSLDNDLLNPDRYIEYSNAYMAINISFLDNTSYFYLIAPLQIPHKSKLRALKLDFDSYGLGPDAIRITISKMQIGVGFYAGSEQNIVDFTAPRAPFPEKTKVNIPIDLIEIDNENYTYSILIKSTSSSWYGFRLYGAIITYQDF